MKLSHLSDDVLDQETLALVQTEREVLSKILHHLREVEKRRLFSKLKFESLYEYAIKRLGYSEDQAARRISAMRLLRELPVIEEKIESGALTLTQLVKAQSLFRQERKAHVPRTQDEKLELLSKIENSTKRETEATLQTESFVFQKLGITPEPAKPVSLDQFAPQVQEKLKRLLALKVHQNPGMSLNDLIDQMADLALEKCDPVKKAERSIARKEASLKSVSPAPARVNRDPSRAIPSAIKHAVFKRDRGACQNCGSNRALEIDHKVPFAMGGASDLSNLRLLCRSCNQRHAIESFGSNKMQRFLREPVVGYH